MTSDERFLSPPQVGRILKTGSDKVLQFIATGELKASNVSLSGRPRWKINPADFQRFLDARSNQAKAKSGTRTRREIPKPSKQYV